VKNNNKILILNTGGTFNKIYNPLIGKLIVPKNNNAIDDILLKSNIYNIKVDNLIYKDSLEINKADRLELVQYIKKSNYNKIIIIHGTDTMNMTAKFLDKNIKTKQIILTGAMIPYSINKIEAISNFMIGYGFLINNNNNNIYISMHGNIKKYTKIKKNYQKGIFKCQ
jgi:L-asparaginase